MLGIYWSNVAKNNGIDNLKDNFFVIIHLKSIRNTKNIGPSGLVNPVRVAKVKKNAGLSIKDIAPQKRNIKKARSFPMKKFIKKLGKRSNKMETKNATFLLNLEKKL